MVLGFLVILGAIGLVVVGIKYFTSLDWFD